MVDWGWAYDGVNSTIPRNAGPECSHYLSKQRQIIECIVVTSICLAAIRWAVKRLQPLPDTFGQTLRNGPGDNQCYYYHNLNRSDICNESNNNSHKHGILLMNDSAVVSSSGSGVGGGLVMKNASGSDSGCLLTAAKPHSQQQLRQICENGTLVSSSENIPGATIPCYVIQMSKLASDSYYVGKQVLLVTMTFILGLELGFKFASRTVIYVLNPCHITTIMQVSSSTNVSLNVTYRHGALIRREQPHPCSP